MLKINMDAVSDIIREVADNQIMPRFNNLHVGDIRFKSEDNPVTIADGESEAELSKRLTDLMPHSVVMGEESYAADPSILNVFESDAPVWIVDPLDGTKAFIAGQPFFGVIVSLALRNQTLAGWLYDPSSKEFIIAERGSGAWHLGKRLSVKKPAAIDQMQGVLNTAFTESIMASVSARTERPKLFHALSSCHDYARLVVQAPHFSKSAEPIHFYGMDCICTPWDIAAGALIHEEAGGYTAHWDEDSFCPCHMGRGFLSAPDKDSWMLLRGWLKSCSKLSY